MNDSTVKQRLVQDDDAKKHEPLVFVCQDNPQHAFWPAERFGKLKHCLPARGDFNVRNMVPRLRAALVDFNAETDFLLLSGAPLACGVAFAILHERFDSFRVLRWSVPAQDYNVNLVNLMEQEIDDDGDNDR